MPGRAQLQQSFEKLRQKNTAPDTERCSACDHFAIYNYSAEIAPVGHAASHAPQSMQESASISYLPSPSEIAPTGHSPSQEPHITHSSLITCAIVYVPSFYDFRRSLIAFAIPHFNTTDMIIQEIWMF